MNEIVIGAIVTVVLGLYEIIKLLIKKMGGEKDKDKSALNTQEREWMKSLYDWHNVSDDDGRKIWYIPKALYEGQKDMLELIRDMQISQKEIADTQKEITATQKGMAETQNQIAITLEKIVEKLRDE